MQMEVRVPTIGESITEATVGQWFKSVGDAIAQDETLLELETDKITVEVPAPVTGLLMSVARIGAPTLRGRRGLIPTISSSVRAMLRWTRLARTEIQSMSVARMTPPTATLRTSTGISARRWAWPTTRMAFAFGSLAGATRVAAK